jgi:cytochrome oxidase assembly protein ShyY1
MKLPPIPTFIVALAVAAMMALGIWQLRRAEWKEALLASAEQAPKLPPIAWPSVPTEPEQLYFRRATGFCLEVTGWRSIAGRNRQEQPGWSHIAACRTGVEGPGMQVDMGWSLSGKPPGWRGGEVAGLIVPDRLHRIRMVASDAAPGLEPSAPPSASSIANNHLFYAIQWFLFALIAVVIFLLAVRRGHFEPKPGESKPS